RSATARGVQPRRHDHLFRAARCRLGAGPMIAHEESVPRFPRLELATLGLTGLEATVWLGLLAATALLHLVMLGSPPLNVDEGRRALEAFTLARDGAVAYDGGPILTN